MRTGHQENALTLPLSLLRLRALVLALGESVSPDWWKTGFMSETGLRFLERIYPRTFLHAAVRSAGKAASDTHDRAVGRVGVYHLFRLPGYLEAEIGRIPFESDPDFVSSFRVALGQPDKLLELLTQLFRRPGMDAGPGAKRLGTDKDLTDPASYERIAAAYHHAFSEGKPGFPYFTIEHIGVGG
ncbi:hypothetical protein B1772_01285 [Dehalococcoides mccartyi]|jgi:hypothetical protein|uniref:BrxE family protein n=1 Tax=Dehalococcoides mccartyi TaxID=61435 RepID=UPI0002B76195|nr:BrxE family protein [Dehalococcoides mccartyi]AGG07406.1 hypothetical protein btf_297 [Dehalococcoides mccartyi BTF08]AQW61767.1 hypothetical protein B1779_00300 [Dehalococcoides mccartyi]AQY72734.1 hypothetical protein B1772_01285 [Dehalococcoides mccartyi]